MFAVAMDVLAINNSYVCYLYRRLYMVSVKKVIGIGGAGILLLLVLMSVKLYIQIFGVWMLHFPQKVVAKTSCVQTS